ncbi:MAG: hypothetical protein JWO11_3569 [Nocardioides sp.]|nr:hypothetical protein [Nocardioides sp.]
MKHRRPSRDNRGGAACILATYAVAAGALAVVYAAVNPLPATQIRDLVSPPAASASVPTRPLSVLPGMGSGLELVRIPRGLDVHTVPWSTGAAHRPVHLHIEGGYVSERHSERHEHVGRHRAPVRKLQAHHDPFEWGNHRGHDHGAGPAGGMGDGHHREQSGRHHVDGSGDFHGHPSDGGRHHRNDGHVGEHHQGSHSQGGHHAEHGGDHGGGRADG